MRRLARGCSSESHPLYGTFMGSLSSCLFEWDQEDYDNLVASKRGELVRAGVSAPPLLHYGRPPRERSLPTIVEGRHGAQVRPPV